MHSHSTVSPEKEEQETKSHQYVARPPVASKVKPVVKLQAGEAMKAVIEAISSKVPVRFIGILAVMYSTCASLEV